MRFRLVVVALTIVFAAVAWQWTAAQAIAVKPVTPRVMSGGDVGFRVEGLRGDTPVGRLVVRVNGRWVEAELSGAVQSPLSTR